jgi:hypothetical protein
MEVKPISALTTRRRLSATAQCASSVIGVLGIRASRNALVKCTVFATERLGLNVAKRLAHPEISAHRPAEIVPFRYAVVG